MDLLLKENLALISGSTAGIGFTIAEGLARESATVIVNGRTRTIWTRSRELSLKARYHLTNDDLLVKVPSLEQILCRGRFRNPGVIARCRAFQQFAPEPLSGRDPLGRC